MEESKSKLNSSFGILRKNFTKLYVKVQETFNKFELDILSAF